MERAAVEAAVEAEDAAAATATAIGSEDRRFMDRFRNMPRNVWALSHQVIVCSFAMAAEICDSKPQCFEAPGDVTWSTCWLATMLRSASGQSSGADHPRSRLRPS